MINKEKDSIKINQDFEFNDGIGGVLREKDVYRFSWPKTILTLSITLILVVLVSVGILEIGKALFIKNTPVVTTDTDIATVSLASVMDDINSDSWEALPQTPNKVTDSLVDNKSDINDLSKQGLNKDNSVDVVNNKIDNSISENNENKIQNPMKTTNASQTGINNSNTVNEPIKVIQKTNVEKVVAVNDTNNNAPVNLYRVIAGSFSKYSNAKNELNRINKLGFNGYIWQTSNNNISIFKIQLAAFKSIKLAKQYQVKLSNKNIDTYIDTE